MFVQGVESSYFCYLGPHAKFRNPRTTFEITTPVRPNIAKCSDGILIFFESQESIQKFGISNQPEERKKERKKERGDKNAKSYGHLRFCLQLKGSAHTPLRPRVVLLPSLCFAPHAWPCHKDLYGHMFPLQITGRFPQPYISSMVKLMLHTENQILRLPASAF